MIPLEPFRFAIGDDLEQTRLEACLERHAKLRKEPPQKVATIKRADKKVGRNEPCPCGSGKKYKHCHGKA